MSRKTLFIATAAALVAAFVIGALVYKSGALERQGMIAGANQQVFARDHAPSLGSAQAKVLIVEFLDPACGTCAQFYPYVKQMLAQHSGKVRLSIRHIPLHPGAEDVVRALEASRKQGRYWQTLEALLANQPQWVQNHVASVDRAWAVLAASGLNLDQLRADMNDPEVARRMETDRADAKTLNVTMTPEYFVDGRPLPSFGLEQLRNLVAQAVSKAY